MSLPSAALERVVAAHGRAAGRRRRGRRRRSAPRVPLSVSVALGADQQREPGLDDERAGLPLRAHGAQARAAERGQDRDRPARAVGDVQARAVGRVGGAPGAAAGRRAARRRGACVRSTSAALRWMPRSLRARARRSRACRPARRRRRRRRRCRAQPTPATRPAAGVDPHQPRRRAALALARRRSPTPRRGRRRRCSRRRRRHLQPPHEPAGRPGRAPPPCRRSWTTTARVGVTARSIGVPDSLRSPIRLRGRGVDDLDRAPARGVHARPVAATRRARAASPAAGCCRPRCARRGRSPRPSARRPVPRASRPAPRPRRACAPAASRRRQRPVRPRVDQRHLRGAGGDDHDARLGGGGEDDESDESGEEVRARDRLTHRITRSRAVCRRSFRDRAGRRRRRRS